MNNPFHELANIFPLMTGSELADLSRDIKRRGLCDPITKHEGKILDGRNRYLACKKAKVRPRYVEHSDGDALDFVVGRNLRRKHYTESQLAMAAEKLADLRDGQTKSKLRHGGEGTTAKEAAEKVGTSERAVNRARRVRQNGTKKVIQAVERGDLPLGVAEEIITWKPREQDAAIDRGVASAIERAKIRHAQKVEATREANIRNRVKREPAIRWSNFVERVGSVMLGMPMDCVEKLKVHDRNHYRTVLTKLRKGLDNAIKKF